MSIVFRTNQKLSHPFVKLPVFSNPVFKVSSWNGSSHRFSFISDAIRIRNQLDKNRIRNTETRRYQYISKILPCNHSHHTFQVVVPHLESPRRYSHEKSGNTPTENAIGFPLVLLFLLFVVLNLEAQAESKDGHEDIPQRIKDIINTDPSDQFTEPRMELFNYLYQAGSKEAEKAKGKDVVIVMGDTGSGKSLLINFLWGCEIQRNPTDRRLLEVHPDSDQPEVAKVCHESASCTLIPTMIGELDVPELDEKIKLSFYDMPGLSDNRGVEIDLATAITMQKIVKNAKSVRFMLVYPYPIDATRGGGWRLVSKFYDNTFEGNLGNYGLSLVITRSLEDVGTIRKDIKKYTQGGVKDLSEFASVYDPLNPNDRKEQLKLLYATKPYGRKDIKIVLKEDRLRPLLDLGKKIAQEISIDLGKNEFGAAERKMRFAKHIAEYNCNSVDLSRMSDLALSGIKAYLDSLHATMAKHGASIDARLPELEKYRKVKRVFEPFMSNFGVYDQAFVALRNESIDDRWAAWDRPTPTVLNGVGTVTCGGLAYAAFTKGSVLAVAKIGGVAIPLLPVAASTAAVCFALFGTYTAIRWLRPYKEDTMKSAYFGAV